MGSASIRLTLAPYVGPMRRDWMRILAVLAAGSATAAVAYQLDQPFSRPVPLALSLHENSGQLRIAWSPLAAIHGATLKILDGSHETTLFVNAPLADVTYTARTADVQVRLTQAGSDGATEIARFLVREPSPAELSAQFKTLLAEAHAIHSALGRQSVRITNLESAARTLNVSTEKNVSKAKSRSAKNRTTTKTPLKTTQETRFWR